MIDVQTPSSPSRIRRIALDFWSRTCPQERSPRLENLAVGAPLDIDAMARWTLMELPNRVDETPYEGVGVSLQEPLTTDLVERSPRTPAEAVVALRHALERAISRTIGGARRVAVVTGGGVDSGALLALVLRMSRDRGGSAFAVALDYRADGDDGPHLTALERHLGCEVLRVPPEHAAHRADLMGGVDGAPFGSPTGQMEVEMLARARAHGAELALTGLGGDELFDGVPSSLSELTQAGHLLRAMRAAHSLRGFDSPRGRVFDWALRPLLRPFVPRFLRMWRARRRRAAVPDWARLRLRESIMRARRRDLDELNAQLAGDMRAEGQPSSRLRTWLAWYRHQQEVASGIQRCDPFLDAGLIAWVERLPRAWLLHGGVRRGLFRAAISGIVPESLRTRDDKAAFEPAMFRFLESIGGFASLRQLARVPHLADLGLVEPRPFRLAFDALAAAPIASPEWGRIWPALCTESFLARHGSEGHA